MFDMAFNQTTSMVKDQLNSYSPEAAGMWNNFKRYFQVSNQYVVGKLRVGYVLCVNPSCCFVHLVQSHGSEFDRLMMMVLPSIYLPVKTSMLLICIFL